MQTTSTLRPTTMSSVSTTFSDSVAHDTETDGDVFDDEITPGNLRRLGLGLRRILAGFKEGKAFSRHHDDESLDELREALSEGREQIAEERRAARRAADEARAELDHEDREVRAARRRGLLAQQADIGGFGSAMDASASWIGLDERHERGGFMRLAQASVQGL